MRSHLKDAKKGHKVFDCKYAESSAEYVKMKTSDRILNLAYEKT